MVGEDEPIRKLIEHLRIESKPGPLGMDILDISDGLRLIRDSGRNGWRGFMTIMDAIVCSAT